jgi:hypothetical protein
MKVLLGSVAGVLVGAVAFPDVIARLKDGLQIVISLTILWGVWKASAKVAAAHRKEIHALRNDFNQTYLALTREIKDLKTEQAETAVLLLQSALVKPSPNPLPPPVVSGTQ